MPRQAEWLFVKVEIRLNGQGQLSAQSFMIQTQYLSCGGHHSQDVSAMHLDSQLFLIIRHCCYTAMSDDGDIARVMLYYHSRFVVDTSNRREMRLCVTNLVTTCSSFPATHSAGLMAEEVITCTGYVVTDDQMYKTLKGLCLYTSLSTYVCILFGRLLLVCIAT